MSQKTRQMLLGLDETPKSKEGKRSTNSGKKSRIPALQEQEPKIVATGKLIFKYVLLLLMTSSVELN